jgi:hypothetical protein
MSVKDIKKCENCLVIQVPTHPGKQEKYGEFYKNVNDIRKIRLFYLRCSYNNKKKI